MPEDTLRPLLGLVAITAAVVGALVLTTTSSMTALPVELALLGLTSLACWYSATVLVKPQASRAKPPRR